MPANVKTEAAPPPPGQSLRVEEYGLLVERSADGAVSVGHEAFAHRVMAGGSADDLAALLALLDSERDRMAREIAEDIVAGDFGAEDVACFGDLHDVCDANVYPAGGRSRDGAYGDEKMGWSDRKTDEHAAALLAHGLIGKGVEAVDPEDTAASESFTGFQNAATDAVDRWIRDGGLEAIPAPRGP